MLRLIYLAIVLALAAALVVGAADALGVPWRPLSLRADNDGLSVTLLVMAALVPAVASLLAFLWEQLRLRRRGDSATPPALYLGLVSVLLLQLALLFAAETAYDLLWKTFK